MKPISFTKTRQQGAIMITALLLMVIMTIIAVSSMENTILEERMASNFGQSVKALQIAEFAASEAERWIENNAHLNLFERPSGSPYVWNDFAGNACGSWSGTSEATTSGNVKGLYTTESIDGVVGGEGCTWVTPCASNLSTCAFDPTREKDWDHDPDYKALPKGYIELGDSISIRDKNYVLQSTTFATVDANDVAQQPRVIIEYIGDYEVGAKDLAVQNYQNRSQPLSRYMFRITVIAWGKDPNTRYVVRSHYQTRWS